MGSINEYFDIEAVKEFLDVPQGKDNLVTQLGFDFDECMSLRGLHLGLPAFESRVRG